MSAEVARAAFDAFTRGLATGDWSGWLALLADDFTFWFPTGRYHGLNEGKARAAEFFAYVTQAFGPGGLEVMLDRVTANETTAVFEFRDQGTLRGEPYRNRVAISLDVRDGKVAAYREYFGSDGKSY
jgi:ketosteroid isomerase-like protein